MILIPVHGTQEKEEYMSKISPLFKGLGRMKSTGARSHPCSRDSGG